MRCRKSTNIYAVPFNSTLSVSFLKFFRKSKNEKRNKRKIKKQFPFPPYSFILNAFSFEKEYTMYSSLILVTLTTLFTVSYVLADCPNSCSGHGTCGADNKCVCYPDYGDADCSVRSCPFGYNAGSGSSQECSGRGTCDQKNGDCKCDAGYEGEACGRTSCPNECSNHGSCVGDSVRSCSCDFGYSGADCSSRLCPRGDDPLTTETYKGSGKAQQDEEQSVTVTLSASGYSLSGDFVLTFADAYGGSWTTRPIDLSTSAEAQAVEDTIESLPNQAFPDVTVSRDTSTTTQRKYTITFNSNANSGDIPAVQCHISGCNLNGCQPRYQGVMATKSWTQTSSATSTLNFRGDRSQEISVTVASGVSCDGSTINFAANPWSVDKQPIKGASIKITTPTATGTITQTKTVTSVDFSNTVLNLDSAMVSCSWTRASPTTANSTFAFELPANTAAAAGPAAITTLTAAADATKTTATAVTAFAATNTFVVTNVGVVTLAISGANGYDLTGAGANIAVGDYFMAFDGSPFDAADENKPMRVTAFGAATFTVARIDGNAITAVSVAVETGNMDVLKFYKYDAWSPFKTHTASVAAGDFVTFSGTAQNNRKFEVASVSSTGRSAQLIGNVYTEKVASASSITAQVEASAASSSTCVVREEKKGTKEADVCSGRGSCDGSSGTCLCYSGYTGEACDAQVNEM